MTIVKLTPRQVRRYGYIPDLPDVRDLLMVRKPLKTIPKKVSFREKGVFGTPFDQGNLGSCTYNAISKTHRAALVAQGKPVFEASRLFGYYGEREIEGTIDVDAGAMIRDGMQVAAKLGMCDETVWPYDIAAFRTRPSDAAYLVAAEHQCVIYRRAPRTVSGVLDTLARGFPIVCGFTVYDSFESDEAARTGDVPVPASGERVRGGHAVVLSGYEQVSKTKTRLEWLNSWGTEWGDGGYFHTSTTFLSKCHVSDLWTIEVTE
jgi:C1A family cysteine protease